MSRESGNDLESVMCHGNSFSLTQDKISSVRCISGMRSEVNRELCDRDEDRTRYELC